MCLKRLFFMRILPFYLAVCNLIWWDAINRNIKSFYCDALLAKMLILGFPQKLTDPKSFLTCHFSLNQTSSFHEKISFSIFCGLYVTTTFPCNLHKMIDPIDPHSHPQGVPQFQAQYIKLNTPCTIAILIIFIYMVANEIL